MTEPVGTSSQTRWPDDPRDIPPPPPPATNGRPADPPEPPEMPDFDAEAYATAARAMGSAGMPQSPALEALGVLHHTHDLEIQNRLDAFRAQATPTYHTQWGDVQVATPFRLPRYPVTPKAQKELDRACSLLKMSRSEVVVLQLGRGTPAQIQRVTQALIDGGALAPDGGSLDDRVRRMMSDHGIGMDCAAYVGQGFAASRGVDRAHSQLGTVRFDLDDLSNLQKRDFVQVGIEAARTGDIVALGPPAEREPGHRAIVYAARDATDADRQFLRIRAAHREAQDEEGALVQLAGSGTLRVLVVDSCWGSGQDPLVGGVERRMWWHDPLTGMWASTNASGTPATGKTPYHHPVEGAYRPRNEP
jgi:hypothetical protein